MSAAPSASRRFESRDLDWVLDLNERHAAELSPLTRAGLAALVGTAALAQVVDPEAAFLIALREDARYESPNFLWLRERRERFLYVDRIAVEPGFRGAGLARRLYQDLFDFAHREARPRVVCEVNTDPPNPGSDAFHAALGFTEIGRARLPDRAKSVRYLELELT